MRIRVTLAAAALALGIVAAANSQVYKPTGGGSSSITAGTTATSGCGAAGVLFSSSNLVQCDTGFTYAGAGGNVAFTGTMSGPASGSSSATTYNFGTAGTGIFGTSTTISFGISTTNQAFLAGTGFTLNSGNYNLAATGNIGWGGAAFLYGPAAATFRFGGNDAASPVAQALGVQNVAAGTSNTGGANFTLNGSRSTGTGVGGKIIMQTVVTGTTGTTQNSLFPLLTLNPGGATTSTLQFGDGTNITTYDSCTGFTSSATGVLACTTSAMRFKDMFPAQALNLVGLDSLRTDIPWKYKDDAGYGLDTKRIHVGLFADDVEKLDSRCVTYEGGIVKDYEDRCVIAYLVADRQKMKAEIEDLKRRVR